ncbi:MAG: hypothetical protein RR359_05975 [Bacilli bacterium]
MIYLMDEQDKKRLDEFINLSLQIEKAHDEIYNLEISGYKNSIIYLLNLSKLVSLISTEMEILNKYINKETVARAYIKQVDSYLKDGTSSYKEALYFFDMPNKHLLRIKQILQMRMGLLKAGSLLPREEDADNLKQEYDHKSICSILIKGGLEEDYNNLFLSLLNDRISKENDESTRNLLIYVKYVLFFIRPDVRYDFLYSSSLNNQLCITSQVISDCMFFDEEEYQLLRKHFSTTNNEEDIKALLEIKDNDYNEIEEVSCFIKSCLLRASLLLMDNDTKQKTIDKYSNTLLESLTNEELSDNSLSEKTLFNILDSKPKDNEIPWNLSLINHGL